MKEIIKGWGNFALGLKTAEAKKKAEICLNCESLENGKIEIIKDNKIKEISGAICAECKCPLSAKLRSDDKCPKGKF